MPCGILPDAESEAGTDLLLAFSPYTKASNTVRGLDSVLGQSVSTSEIIVVGAARDSAV